MELWQLELLFQEQRRTNLAKVKFTTSNQIRRLHRIFQSRWCFKEIILTGEVAEEVTKDTQMCYAVKISEQSN